MQFFISLCISAIVIAKCSAISYKTIARLRTFWVLSFAPSANIVHVAYLNSSLYVFAREHKIVEARRGRDMRKHKEKNCWLKLIQMINQSSIECPPAISIRRRSERRRNAQERGKRDKACFSCYCYWSSPT